MQVLAFEKLLSPKTKGLVFIYFIFHSVIIIEAVNYRWR